MNKELVSIIIPVYNAEKWIKKTLESVIYQTYTELDILVIDDGSTDSSYQICTEFAKADGRITLVHQENAGPSSARNKGLEMAVGEYITFVDADDYLADDYIEYLYKEIINLQVDIASCSQYVAYSYGVRKKADRRKSKKITSAEALKRMLYGKGVTVGPWAKLYRKELWNNVRFPEGLYFEDLATTYKLIDKCKSYGLGYSKKYYYCIHEESVTTSSFNEKQLDMLTAANEVSEYVICNHKKMYNAAIRFKVWAYLSTLNRIYKAAVDFPKLENQIILEILKNRKYVLLDKNSSVRDKVGVLSLSLNRKLYKEMWNIYIKAHRRT